MKDVISVDKVIVNYRIKCDIDLSDREELLISQEEYEEAIQFNLNRSKEDLHSLLISKLPEKHVCTDECKINSNEWRIGHRAYKDAESNCIDDMRKSIAEMFRSW